MLFADHTWNNRFPSVSLNILDKSFISLRKNPQNIGLYDNTIAGKFKTHKKGIRFKEDLIHDPEKAQQYGLDDSIELMDRVPHKTSFRSRYNRQLEQEISSNTKGDVHLQETMIPGFKKIKRLKNQQASSSMRISYRNLYNLHSNTIPKSKHFINDHGADSEIPKTPNSKHLKNTLYKDNGILNKENHQQTEEDINLYQHISHISTLQDTKIWNHRGEEENDNSNKLIDFLENSFTVDSAVPYIEKVIKKNIMEDNSYEVLSCSEALLHDVLKVIYLKTRWLSLAPLMTRLIRMKLNWRLSTIRKFIL